MLAINDSGLEKPDFYFDLESPAREARSISDTKETQLFPEDLLESNRSSIV